MRHPAARLVAVAALSALLPALRAAAQSSPSPAPQAVQAGEALGSVKPVEVEAEGTAASRDAAIDKALLNAIKQEGGTEIANATASVTVDAASRVTTGQGQGAPGTVAAQPIRAQDVQTTAAQGQLRGAAAETLSFTGGRVLRYQVRSVSAVPEGFVARVHAILQLTARTGGTGGSRKRIAIATFATDHPTPLADALHDQLLLDLTQSRRFAVVDREHDEAYQAEIATVRNADAPAAEQAHAGQVLGADFILLGKLHVTDARTVGHAAQTESHVIELTGEVVSHTSASTRRTLPGAATTDFELMEVATRQVILADRDTVTGNSVEQIAQHITDGLLQAIYPPRLVSTADPQALVINEGGSLIHVGQRFRVMSEGTELFDPYTHESLGKQEQLAAELEVTDVASRMSTARLLSGTLPQGGGVLRIEAPPPPAPVVRRITHHAPRPAPEAPDQGVRLPFDH